VGHLSFYSGREAVMRGERSSLDLHDFPISKMQYHFLTICLYCIMTGRSSKQTLASLMQCICKNEPSLCPPFVIQETALARGMTYAMRGYSNSRQDSTIMWNDQPSLHRLVNRPHDRRRGKALKYLELLHLRRPVPCTN